MPTEVGAGMPFTVDPRSLGKSNNYLAKERNFLIILEALSELNSK
jgi:hypothetical protein